MRLIKPYYEIESDIDGEVILRHLERAARTCYKSEHQIGDYEKTKKFVAGLIKRGHESTIEHYSLSVRFIVDRGVTHELVRHRLAAYSQECVTGDTNVHKNFTIKELYNRQFGSHYDKTHNKAINLKSVNDCGQIIPNKFNEVFYKGIQDVYRVTTNLGYTIKCTLNHEFKDNLSMFKQLKNFNIGDSLFVNGRPSLLKIDDEKLSFHYLEEKLSPLEISYLYSVPVCSVYNRLSKNGIFVTHMNDKDKEKYSKNHTKESYEKMKNSIKSQYKNGRIVWNKGLTEYENESVKKQANTLRKNHHNNGHGENNSRWDGGPKGHVLAELLKQDITMCELCNDNNNLEVHHIDKNVNNNSMKNLLKCCNSCHNLMHHGWYVGKKEILDTIVSIDYVGKEETYDIEMKDPYHNYVANGFIVHNSTRFCNYTKDEFSGHITYIIPPWMKLEEGVYRVDPETNKFYVNDEEFCPTPAGRYWLSSLAESEMCYFRLVDYSGWVPQQARSVLPNALKTEIVASANLREWRHIFKMRAQGVAGKPHPQMSEVMIPLLKDIQEKIPIVFDDIYI